MPVQSKFLLIDGDIEGGQRALYVYRDTGSGKADGSYLKRYDERVSVEQIAQDVGGGAFILIEQGGGKPFTRRRVIIPHDKAKESEMMTFDDDGDILKRMERMIQLKAAANMLKPEMDMIQTLKAVLEIVNATKGQTTDAADLFDTFREGIDFAGNMSGVPTSPEAILATSALKLAEREPTPAAPQTNTIPPVFARVAAALNKKLRAVTSELAELRVIKHDIEAIKTALARSAAPGGTVQQQAEDLRGEESRMNTLVMLCSLIGENQPETPEALQTFLQLAEAKTSNLKGTIKNTEPLMFDDLLRNVLEEIGRADLFDMYREGLRTFAGISGT